MSAQEQGKQLSKHIQTGGMTPSGNNTQTQGFGIASLQQSAELSAVAVAAAAKAQVEAAYIVALKHPRNEDNARTRILNRCRQVGFAEKAKYRKPIGAGSVEGFSIRFAEEMMSLWGNLTTQASVLYEDDYKRIIKVTVIDLETNNSYATDITIDKAVERKSGASRTVLSERVNSRGERVFLVVATEDEVQTKTASAVSKSIRNSGLRLIPGYIKEEALTTIADTLKKGLTTDPEAARRKICDAFNALGIAPADLEKYLGQTISTVSANQLEDLRDTYNALKDGETTWAELMSSKKTQDAPATGDLEALGAGDAKTHQGHDAVSDRRKALLAVAAGYEKVLTKDVFVNMLGNAGFEKLEQMSDKDLTDFIESCKATAKAK